MGLIDTATATTTDIAAAGASGLVAVLPVGAVEQHGPHLPLLTDTILATGVARRIADRIGGWLLPAIGYVPSGVGELLKKQQQGWAYVRP